MRPPRLTDAKAIFESWAQDRDVPEATRAIIDWAFQQPTIYRVYATTDVENVASQRVLEKEGMQCEGILRKYIIHPNLSDIPRDSYIYAIIR